MVFVLFEEVLWGLTGGLMRFFGRFAPVAWIEDRIRRLPPIWALPGKNHPWSAVIHRRRGVRRRFPGPPL